MSLNFSGASPTDGPPRGSGRAKHRDADPASAMSQATRSPAGISRGNGRMLMKHRFGIHVGEAAATSIGDVRNADGTVKTEIRLDASQTTGKHACVNRRAIGTPLSG
jgi:hypothetical protein